MLTRRGRTMHGRVLERSMNSWTTSGKKSLREFLPILRQPWNRKGDGSSYGNVRRGKTHYQQPKDSRDFSGKHFRKIDLPQKFSHLFFDYFRCQYGNVRRGKHLTNSRRIPDFSGKHFRKIPFRQQFQHLLGQWHCFCCWWFANFWQCRMQGVPGEAVWTTAEGFG